MPRVVIRWREEPFECQLLTGSDGRVLIVSTAEGVVVREEPVASAAAAYDRARQVRDLLVPGGRKRA